MAFSNRHTVIKTHAWTKRKKWAKEHLDYACQSTDGDSCQGRLELDHITPRSLGGDESDENLQWLCALHHRRKTQAEACRARQLKAKAAKYPAEVHPGLR